MHWQCQLEGTAKGEELYATIENECGMPGCDLGFVKASTL